MAGGGTGSSSTTSCDEGFTPAGEGEPLLIEVQPAKQWPEPDVPADLQAALADAPDVAELWSDITPMARWEWVRWIAATQQPRDAQTARRGGDLEAALGEATPRCFDLAACTDPELAQERRAGGRRLTSRSPPRTELPATIAPCASCGPDLAPGGPGTLRGRRGSAGAREGPSGYAIDDGDPPPALRPPGRPRRPARPRLPARAGRSC